MAAFDIMPFKGPGGQHCVAEHGVIDPTSTFSKGEPIRYDADGFLEAAGDEPGLLGAPGAGVIGIAMANTADVVTAFSVDETQATASGDGVTVPYVVFQNGDTYVTRNFSTDDVPTFTAVPAVSNIGDLAALAFSTPDYGIEVNTSATNRVFRVVDVLDDDGVSIAKSGGTGTQVEFRLEF